VHPKHPVDPLRIAQALCQLESVANRGREYLIRVVFFFALAQWLLADRTLEEGVHVGDQHALGLFESAHLDGFRCDSADEVTRLCGARLSDVFQVLRNGLGDSALPERGAGLGRESPAAITTVTLGRSVHRAAEVTKYVRRSLYSVRDLGGIDQDELFLTDENAIHVRQTAPPFNGRSIHDHAISAAQIVNKHCFRSYVKHRMFARDELV
jgi:hypothetical protein